MSERCLEDDSIEKLVGAIGEVIGGEESTDDYLIVFVDDLYPQSCPIR